MDFTYLILLNICLSVSNVLLISYLNYYNNFLTGPFALVFCPFQTILYSAE